MYFDLYAGAGVMIDQKSIRSSGMIDVLGNRLIPHLAGSQKNV